MQMFSSRAAGNSTGWRENTHKSLWLTWIAITSLRINQMRTISVQVDENKSNPKKLFWRISQNGLPGRRPTQGRYNPKRPVTCTGRTEWHSLTFDA